MQRLTAVCSALVASLAIAGCGGSGDIAGPTGTNTCNVALTGAVTSTQACSVSNASWSSSANETGITLLVSGTPAVSIAMSFNGEPQVVTYTDASSGAAASVSVTTSAGTWLTNIGSGTPVGTFSLTMSSVSTESTVNSGKTYLLHGTLTATLVAVADGVAPVTLQATF